MSVITFPAHVNSSEPIFLPYVHGERTLRFCENSCVTIVEEIKNSETKTESLLNNTFKIHLEKNAQLHWIQFQHLSKNISRAADYQITQAENSKFEASFFSLGGHVSKDVLRITQQGARAESFLYGLSLPRQDGQTISHHVEVNHQASQGTSYMLFKGILDNKSHTVFHGKVVVHKNVEKINAFQANHHLLLCAEASAKSLPELEIDADDVKCTQGTTVGQLDQNALFYLRARGISEILAKKMLTDAFAAEIFSKVKIPAIQAWLMQQVEAHA